MTAVTESLAVMATPRQRRTLRLPKGWGTTVLLSIPVPVLLVIVWHFGVANAWELPFGVRMAYLPYPLEVATTLWDFAFGGIRNDAFSGALWINLVTSVMRVAVGFFVAAAIAIPLGVFMGRYYVINSLFDGVISLIRPIPATAWVPLVLLLIGVGDQATYFLITLSAFFPIVLGTISGARQVPQRLVEGAQMLGSGPVAILLRVIVPASVPAIVNGLRIGLGLAWVVLVLGESSGTSVGLGATISLARDIVRTDLIVVCMLCIGLAGLLSDRLLVGIFQLAFRGRPLLK